MSVEAVLLNSGGTAVVSTLLRLPRLRELRCRAVPESLVGLRLQVPLLYRPSDGCDFLPAVLQRLPFRSRTAVAKYPSASCHSNLIQYAMSDMVKSSTHARMDYLSCNPHEACRQSGTRYVQLNPGPCCLETLHLRGCSFVSVDLAAVTTLRDLDISQAVRHFADRCRSPCALAPGISLTC